MAERMAGKVTVITGAAKGIGRGIAGAFAAEGAMLVIADIDQAAGTETAAKLSAGGAAAEFVKVDVTSQASCETAVKAVLDKHGHIDILCSNAGVYPQALVAEMTETDWDKIFAINVKGMFFMVKSVLPGMRVHRYGRIVLTSSVTGPVTGYPGWAHYGATKAAMLGFMRSARFSKIRRRYQIESKLKLGPWPGAWLSDTGRCRTKNPECGRDAK